MIPEYYANGYRKYEADFSRVVIWLSYISAEIDDVRQKSDKDHGIIL